MIKPSEPSLPLIEGSAPTVDDHEKAISDCRPSRATAPPPPGNNSRANSGGYDMTLLQILVPFSGCSGRTVTHGIKSSPLLLRRQYLFFLPVCEPCGLAAISSGRHAALRSRVLQLDLHTLQRCVLLLQHAFHRRHLQFGVTLFLTFFFPVMCVCI